MQINDRNTQSQTRRKIAKVARAARSENQQTRNRPQDELAIRLVKTENPLPTHRALVPVGGYGSSQIMPKGRANRISAPLVTHLVATRMGMPQTRARRRAPAGYVCKMYSNINRAPDLPETGTHASKYF